MPVSGLILNLVESEDLAQQAIRDLSRDERFTRGEALPRRLPVTLETQNPDEDKACWQWLQDHPGIAFVDVACVFFDEDEEGAPSPEIDDADGTCPMPVSEQPPTRSRSW